MRELAARGRAILMISSDLPEVVGVSDRIVVMREGRIAGELPRRRDGRGRDGARGRPRREAARARRMSARSSRPRRSARRRCLRAPLLLFLGSVALYVGGRAVDRRDQDARTPTASSGCCSAWSRSAIGRARPDFVILGGSIDLSVANMISVAAVLASFIMQGDPDDDAARRWRSCSRSRARRRRQRPRHRSAQRQSADRDARRRASSCKACFRRASTISPDPCRRSSRPSLMARSASCPIRSLALFALAALGRLAAPRRPASAHISTRWAATPRARVSLASAPIGDDRRACPLQPVRRD